jgi:dihydroflavonol-4-reductase
MKRILITGASGFIGTALTKRLLKPGYELYLLSRSIEKLSGTSDTHVKKYQTDLLDATSLKRIEHDLRSIDVVIHLSASVNYFGDRRSLYRSNVLSSLNLFTWAQRLGAKKFIFTSSIEAMGTCGRPSPATEFELVRPVSSYGLSKLAAEKALAGANDRAMDLVILRIGNVFGPGSSFMIPSLAISLLRHDKYFRFFPCYKDQVFQLIYIDDVVEGIIKAVEGGHVAGTYILAGDEPMTAEGIMRMISEVLSIEFKLEPGGSWQHDYLRFRTRILRMISRADFLTFLMAGSELGPRRTFLIAKAKKGLGFSPRVSLRQGTAMTLDWARENMLNERR